MSSLWRRPSRLQVGASRYRWARSVKISERRLSADTSEIQGLVSSTTVNYDYLVFAVGAEVQTFNIPGVKENACFMKELEDAEKVALNCAFSFDSPLTSNHSDATAFLGL